MPEPTEQGAADLSATESAAEPRAAAQAASAAQARSAEPRAPESSAAALESPRPAGRARGALYRLLGIVVLLLGLALLARACGLHELISVPWLRAQVQGAGPWGVALLLAAFTLGLLLQVPGMVFAATAILCYGPWAGGLLAYLGGTFAVCAVFLLVRGAGGDLLDELDRPWLRAALERIHERPVRTVALLRLVFWTSPQLNYALALSGVRFVPHLLGTLIGLIPIKVCVVLFFDRVLAYLGLS
ncbi:MAG: TVP38/TMEM64 family protein [Planctomycetota bacterium]